MADVKWIKIVTDIFDDEKILMIETLPECDTIIVIWFKLLCLAGKQNNSGVFQMGHIPYTDEMFSTIFRRPLNTVRLALSTFERFGMVEIINDVITIPNWGKHQSLEQLEERRKYQREYQREYRKKQKLLTSGESSDGGGKCLRKHLHEPNVNTLDKEEERDIDREEDKKSVRETTRTLFERLLPDYIMSDALKEKMSDWITYKTERKEPYKEQGMKSLLRQIENNYLTYGEQAVCELIDESMANNWKGIIFDRLKQKKPARSGSNGGASGNHVPNTKKIGNYI